MSPAAIQERIEGYCTRYKVKERNADGFPVFPAGKRETEQHRKWIALYKLFSRARQRVDDPRRTANAETLCPVCLQPGALADTGHTRCAAAVDLARHFGRPVLTRIARAAFPDPVRPPRTRGE